MSKKLYEENSIRAIADAIREKNGTQYTYKISDMPNAIISIPTTPGEGANILCHYGMPDSSFGEDNSICMVASDLGSIVGEKQKTLFTNNVVINIQLSNWTYRASDRILFGYKNKGSHNGNWGRFLSTPNFKNLMLQHNLYWGRKCINVYHNGAYSGDDAYSFSSPQDLSSYFVLELDGSDFTICSGPKLSSASDIQVKTTIGGSDDTDLESPILFAQNEGNAVNVEFYWVLVYRNEELIHAYIPVSGGIKDFVDSTVFQIGDQRVEYGEYNYNYDVRSVLYKENSVWKPITDIPITRFFDDQL